MKPKAVQAYLNPMQDVAREFVDKMAKNRDKNNEVPNFLGELYKWALECKWSFHSEYFYNNIKSYILKQIFY